MLGNFNWGQVISQSPILMVLIAMSMVTLALVLERGMYFRKRGQNPDVMLARGMEAAQKGNSSEVSRAFDGSPHPIGTVVPRLMESDLHREDDEALFLALSDEKMLLDRGLGHLGSVAAIAPLLGLLGTVWGIMRAFQDMSTSGSAAPTVVAGGVSEALTTTAAGLIIAVPAVLLYNHFTKKSSVMLTEAENGARRLRAELRKSSPVSKAA
jgi:biopolymer transport protein ExbB